MSRELETYNSCTRKLMRMRLWVGLNPEFITTLSNHSLTWIHLVGVCVATSGFVKFSYCKRAERLMLIDGLSWTVGLLGIIFKTISLTTRRNRLTELHVGLTLVFERDLTSDVYRPLLLSPFSHFYLPTLVLVFSTWGIFGLTFFKPFIGFIVQRVKHGKILHYARPLDTLYPWIIEPHTWRFPVFFVFELYVLMISAVIGSIADALFSYYVFQICGQLRTLSHRLKNLATSENYRQDLRECSEQYRTLKICRQHLDQIYGPVILWLTIFNSVSICVLLYHLAHTSYRKVPAILIYIVMKAAQTFIYGWFGTCLTTESEYLREAIYSSDWPGSGQKRHGDDVLVMLMYRPFILSTCGIANVSVDLFVKVSNTALSYYFMLRALDE